MHLSEIGSTLSKTLFHPYATLSPTGDGTGSVLQLVIPFFTQYERRGIIYRAHPKYRGDHAYYDWAFVKWVIGTNPVSNVDIHKPYVARILGFIRHPDGDVRAVIQSVKETRNKQNVAHGVFSYFWELEQEGPNTARRPVLHLVSVDTLMEHACMIPYTKKDHSIWFHVWHPRKWGDCFCSNEEDM